MPDELLPEPVVPLPDVVPDPDVPEPEEPDCANAGDKRPRVVEAASRAVSRPSRRVVIFVDEFIRRHTTPGAEPPKSARLPDVRRGRRRKAISRGAASRWPSR